MEKLTPKQQKFVDYYIQTGNATEAAKLAGYSPKTAYSIGNENLNKPEIKNAIQARLKELESQRVANAQETLELITAIMRGELESEEYAVVGTGAGFSKVEIFRKKPSTRERLQAATTLARIHGLMKDKVEVEVNASELLIEALTEVWEEKNGGE